MIFSDDASLVPHEDIRARTERRWPQLGAEYPPIVVLITSASHRRPSLLRCLDALRAQDAPIDRVLLRLDGPARADHTGLLVPSPWELVIFADHELGPGRRWAHPGLEFVEPWEMLVTLDDDLLLEPHALGEMVRMVVCENTAITWHGWRHEPDSSSALGSLRGVAEYDQQVAAVGTGIAAFRWRWVQALVNHPLVPLFLERGPACDDDALLALHLWEHGVRVQRPRGRAPLAETDQATDGEAGASRYEQIRAGARLALTLAFDCPCGPYAFPPRSPQAIDSFEATIVELHEIPWDPAEHRVIDCNLRRTIHRLLAQSRNPQIRALLPSLAKLEPEFVITINTAPPLWLELYALCRQIIIRVGEPDSRADLHIVI